MNPRSPARQQRAADRAERRATLLVLLDRLDRLSPAERELLRESVLTVLTEAEQVTRARRGLDRARDRMQYRIDAAEKAMVEVEQDRDRARAAGQAALRLAERAGKQAIANAQLADRHYAAWRSARERARRTETERERIRGWLTHWANRARTAEAALANVRAALDAIDHDRARLAPEAESFGDGYADAAARIRIALDEPSVVPASTPSHLGNEANAEDCPACSDTNPPYPFICPGQPKEPTL